MNLTVIMSAHVFTSISLFKLAATYRIYREGYLLFEQSELIDTLEFPIIICKKLVPITTPTNYSIEATIFGPMTGFPIGITLFEGVKYARLVPGTDNNITISMLYIGNCYLYFKKNILQGKSHAESRKIMADTTTCIGFKKQSPRDAEKNVLRNKKEEKSRQKLLHNKLSILC
jgi:hypothetical protein